VIKIGPIEMYLRNPKLDEIYMDILKVSKEELERGKELHKKYISIDYSSGPKIFTDRIIQKFGEMSGTGKSAAEITSKLEYFRTDEYTRDPKAREEYVEAWDKSGVTAIISPINPWEFSLPALLRRFAELTYRYEKMPDALIKAVCAEDIRKAKKKGIHAQLWHFQETQPFGAGGSLGVDIDRELDNIDMFYRIGVRSSQLTYNLRNYVGDGCTERNPSGLTRFGEMVIERMNKIGMIVDTAHASKQTTLDACEVSKSPVIATHTACRALSDHPRNKTDEEISALAETGGYIGIHLTTSFISDEKYTEKGTPKMLLDQIDHVRNLVGVDHVGIGTDKGYWYRPPAYMKRTHVTSFTKFGGWAWWMGYADPKHRYPQHDFTIFDQLWWTNWPYYVVALVSAGYSDQEIEKIIGGNFMRVYEKVVG